MGKDFLDLTKAKGSFESFYSLEKPYERAIKVLDEYNNIFELNNLIHDVKLSAQKDDVTQECAQAILKAYDELGVSEDLDDEGEGHNSGEILKYGGKEGDAWCASFVSWLYGEGQGKENNDNTFGYQISVSQLMKLAQDEEFFGDVESYSPKPGDIMIQKENGSSHTGLYIASDDKYIYTIEGNAQDAVRAKRYDKNGEEYKKISGYIKMSEWTKDDSDIVSFASFKSVDFEDADEISKKTV